jgi:hypothetical protein
MSQPSGDALAELEALLADHDSRTAAYGKLLRPIRNVGMRAADSAGNQARVAGEVLVRANVDEGRAIVPADQADKLVG